MLKSYGQGPYMKEIKALETDLKQLQERITEKMGNLFNHAIHAIFSSFMQVIFLRNALSSGVLPWSLWMIYFKFIFCFYF